MILYCQCYSLLTCGWGKIIWERPAPPTILTIEIHLKVAVKPNSHPPQPFIKCKSLLTRARRARRAPKMIPDVRLDLLESTCSRRLSPAVPQVSPVLVRRGDEPREIMHRHHSRNQTCAAMTVNPMASLLLFVNFFLSTSIVSSIVPIVRPMSIFPAHVNSVFRMEYPVPRSSPSHPTPHSQPPPSLTSRSGLKK